MRSGVTARRCTRDRAAAAPGLAASTGLEDTASLGKRRNRTAGAMSRTCARAGVCARAALAVIGTCALLLHTRRLPPPHRPLPPPPRFNHPRLHSTLGKCVATGCPPLAASVRASPIGMDLGLIATPGNASWSLLRSRGATSSPTAPQILREAPSDERTRIAVSLQPCKVK